MAALFQSCRDFCVKNAKWLLPIGILVLLVFPLVYTDSYYLSIVVKMLIYILLASSLNLINGYSGQFNIGHAGFISIGAYTAAILATKLNFSFWPLLLLSGIVAGVIGCLISLPTLRLSGIYLSIVTLGFSEIIRLIVLNWNSVTNGPLGIKAIPSPSFFGFTFNTPNRFYYICLAMVALVIFLCYRILHSRIGRAWIAIREDQLAASALGVELNHYKMLNFVCGAFFGGVGGCLMAFFYRFISADMFNLDEGFNILSMVIIGGQGTLVGPALGTVVVYTLTEMFRFAEEYRMVFYAVLIIFMMWWRPQGLAGASNSILAGAKANREQMTKSKTKVGVK